MSFFSDILSPVADILQPVTELFSSPVTGLASKGASIAGDIMSASQVGAIKSADIASVNAQVTAASMDKEAADAQITGAQQDIIAAHQYDLANQIAAAAAGTEAAGIRLQGQGAQIAGVSAAVQGLRSRLESEFEAQQYEAQAGATIAASHRAAFLTQRDTDLTQSRALALAAASGGGATDPGIVTLMGRTAGEGAYRVGLNLYQGEEQARILRMAAEGKRYEGASAELLGVSEAAARGIQAAALGTEATAAEQKGQATLQASAAATTARVAAANKEIQAAQASKTASDARIAALNAQIPAIEAKATAGKFSGASNLFSDLASGASILSRFGMGGSASGTFDMGAVTDSGMLADAGVSAVGIDAMSSLFAGDAAATWGAGDLLALAAFA